MTFQEEFKALIEKYDVEITPYLRHGYDGSYVETIDINWIEKGISKGTEIPDEEINKNTIEGRL